MQSRAFFFDRDGIINKRLVDDYVKSINELELLSDIFDIFSLVKSKNFISIVITNQQGIGKGLMTESDLDIIHEEIQKIMLENCGANFDEFYFCPDLKTSKSKRRKPEPGMLLEAIEKWGINPEESWMLGDSPSDVIAGKRAGTKTILVGNFKKEEIPEADYIFTELIEVKQFLESQFI